MEKKWNEWIKMAKASEIKELSHFAKKKDKKRRRYSAMLETTDFNQKVKIGGR